jgi:flagella basal body P-ring formation protein FlgA
MNLLPALALAFSLAATSVLAAPVLKAQVDVAAEVVTVGDMFADAGTLAERPLFLAPRPGTSGTVPLSDVRLAAAKAGLETFDDGGAASVRVTRLATPIEAAALTALMSADLRTRGILSGDETANVSFDTRLDGLTAAAVAEPAQLVYLRYAPATGLFSARFALAGIDTPLDLTGRIELMVPAPELVRTLPAGAILAADDLAMRPVPLRLVQNGNVASLDQLVGKQLARQSRAGMVLKASDVADPQLIARNDPVTVYLHAGPLTLTVKGTALNAASLGQPVAVLNTMSKRVVHGIARAGGAVEIATSPLSVAGL